MKRVTLIALAIAALGISAPALADSTHAKIRSVDTEQHILVLSNGFRLHYGDDVNPADLTPGAWARVIYKRDKHDQLEATKIDVKPKD